MAATHFPSLLINPIPQSHHFTITPPPFPLFPRTLKPLKPINCTPNNGVPIPSSDPLPFADPPEQDSPSPLPFADPPEDDDSPLPFSTTQNNANYPIEKRRQSEIRRRAKSARELLNPSTPPPNYEIGWKRTKPIKQIEKPVGYTIMDFLEKLEILITGREFGSTRLLEKVGEIVAERVREEAELLKEEGKVEERMVTELFRVLRLMEMDLAMVKAAVKEETVEERLNQAKARCRQAILVAGSF
ncbi:Protein CHLORORESPIRATORY REDUCTION 41, chloroplastic [Linum perenne]